MKLAENGDRMCTTGLPGCRLGTQVGPNMIKELKVIRLVESFDLIMVYYDRFI